MTKTVPITESKAIQVSGINVGGKLMVSLRQMHKRKKDTEWQFGRNGLSVEVDAVETLVKSMLSHSKREESEFKVLTLGKRKKND